MKKYIVIWLIVAILINMLLLLSLASANPAGWSEDINLTPDDDKDSRKPSIGIFKDNIHVVWKDSRHYPVTNRPEIYYRNSSDGGKTWNPEVRLTFSDSTKNYPRIAVNGNNIHIIWTDDRGGGGYKIFYKNSTDGGSTWSDDKRISQTSGEDADIANNGSNIHVTYIINFKLFYINSTDNGITWSEPQQLTGPIRDSDHPAIAVNGSNVHIVWMDHYDRFGTGTMGAIFYLNSSDSGLTWSEDFNLTPMNLDADYPDIDVNGDNIHLTYGEERSGLWQIYYRGSEDNGITWTEEFMLSNSADNIARSVVKVKQNAIYVSWSDPKNPTAEIYLRNSTDNGQNWDDEIRLTYDSAAAYYPDIALGNESLHLVWSDWRDGAPEIYYKHYPFYYPPNNLSIDILGTKLILNWTAPQNSPSLVDHYLIYRTTTWDDFDFSFLWVNTSVDDDNGIIPLRTSWNDTTAILDETYDYYYVVRAVYENGEIDSNENIVGKFVIPLNSGWNLISLPLAQNDTIIQEVLKSIDGNYNIVQWYDAKNGIWHSSSTSLTDINRTMGLWIHMKNSCNLSIVGAVPESTDIALYEGWNLVSYPSLKTRNLNNALSGITWQAVQQYNAFDINDPWKHNSTKKPDRLNDLKEMQPGRGYWMYVTINDTWVRTRTIEDEKVVIWRFGVSEEEIVHDQFAYEPTIGNPIEMKEENDYKMDNVNEEKPIIRNEENNLIPSLVPLIILMAIIFAEIKLFHKKKI